MTEFKNHMSKKLYALLAFVGCFAIVFGIGQVVLSLYVPMLIVQETPGQDAMDIRKAAPGSPEAVMAKHADECWTMNEQALVNMPGAAIVQFNDGKTVYTKKPALVEEALNEALAAIGFGDKVSERLTVIALCT